MADLTLAYSLFYNILLSVSLSLPPSSLSFPPSLLLSPILSLLHSSSVSFLPPSLLSPSLFLPFLPPPLPPSLLLFLLPFLFPPSSLLSSSPQQYPVNSNICGGANKQLLGGPGARRIYTGPLSYFQDHSHKEQHDHC